MLGKHVRVRLVIARLLLKSRPFDVLTASLSRRRYATDCIATPAGAQTLTRPRMGYDPMVLTTDEMGLAQRDFHESTRRRPGRSVSVAAVVSRDRGTVLTRCRAIAAPSGVRRG